MISRKSSFASNGSGRSRDVSSSSLRHRGRAGTMNPPHASGPRPEPWRVGYVEPSRRPPTAGTAKTPTACSTTTSTRSSSSPPRQHHRPLSPEPRSPGHRARAHDIRFVEDDWESPTVGAWGLGWEVWLDGMEVTQFTYFQQVGGIDIDWCPPRSPTASSASPCSSRRWRTSTTSSGWKM